MIQRMFAVYSARLPSKIRVARIFLHPNRCLTGA